MSKKKAPAKGKAAEPAVNNDAPAISSDQSEEAKNYRKILRIMATEIESEKRILNDFHQQIDKIRAFWAIEKKRLEDLEATQRRKSRSSDDLTEKHNYELSIYKMKICHVLHEQQARLTDIRTDNEVRLNRLQTENRAAEHELRDVVWDVKQQLREFDLGHIDLVRMQKHEHEKNVMQLRREYQRRAEEMRLAFEDAMASVRKQKSEIRKNDVKKIERIKSEHIAHLTSLHKDEFQQIKNYYHDITHNNLDLIKSLKEEVLDLKKKEHNDEKAMAEIAQVNKRLSEPLKKHLREIEELRAELRNYERDKVQLQATKEKIGALENKLKNISWEYEVLFQKEQQTREERDLLQTKLDKALVEVQKRSSFRTLLLETKIDVLQADIERKETALHQVLISTNLQPELLGEPSHRLEDVLQQKNEQIKELQDRCNEIKAMYAHVIQVYNDRLRQFRIHPAGIGFQPEQLV